MAISLNIEDVEIKLGDGAEPEAYTVVTGITAITLPNLEADRSDLTAYGSSKTRQFVATLSTLSDMEITLRVDPTNTNHMRFYTLDESKDHFFIQFSTAARAKQFRAQCMSLAEGTDIDKHLMAVVKIMPNEAMTAQD